MDGNFCSDSGEFYAASCKLRACRRLFLDHHLVRIHSFLFPRTHSFVRKFLLFPLRLAVGWGLSPRLLGLIGATMLVLLRLSIGWHFYSEGVDKRAAGDWSAAPFFANAKGPFAEQFRQMVWDADGKLRLDREATMIEWASFATRSPITTDSAKSRNARRRRTTPRRSSNTTG